MVALKVKLGIAKTIAEREGADEIATAVTDWPTRPSTPSTHSGPSPTASTRHCSNPKGSSRRCGRSSGHRASRSSGRMHGARPIRPSGRGNGLLLRHRDLERARMSGATKAHVSTSRCRHGELVTDIELGRSTRDADSPRPRRPRSMPPAARPRRHGGGRHDPSSAAASRRPSVDGPITTSREHRCGTTERRSCTRRWRCTSLRPSSRSSSIVEYEIVMILGACRPSPSAGSSWCDDRATSIGSDARPDRRGSGAGDPRHRSPPKPSTRRDTSKRQRG